MERQRFPPGWWGGHGWWGIDLEMSLVELLEAGSLDGRLAALLWLMMERRASIVVAATPPMAGKTTVLTALIDLLPPDTETVFTQGRYETFAFLDRTEPSRAYILCNEISPDLSVYLWGRPVRRLFEALPLGYGLGTTMHADSVNEVISILQAEPLGVPAHLVAYLTLVLVLQVTHGSREVRRRIRDISLIGPSAQDGLAISVLATWDGRASAYQHAASPQVWQAVAQRMGMAVGQLEAELSRREGLLHRWAQQGVRAPQAVREMVARYYGKA